MPDAVTKYTGDEKVDVYSEESKEDLVVAYHIDPEEEKAVLRKLDRVILPLMALVYFFQCMTL